MSESLSRAAPSSWVVRFAPLVAPAGAVLDLACGSGRHALFFRERGHTVVTIDRDLSKLGTAADAGGIEAIAADLEVGAGWPLGDRRFAGVVVTNYLHRPLFPAIVGAVAVGGVLIYETFATGNERFGKPSNPAFLLRPGELLDAVRGELRVVAYEDGMTDTPRRMAIQRICAVRQAAIDGPPALPDPV